MIYLKKKETIKFLVKILLKKLSLLKKHFFNKVLTQEIMLVGFLATKIIYDAYIRINNLVFL